MCKFSGKKLWILWILRQLGANGGDDEAAEGAVELVRTRAEELGVGAIYVLVSSFAILDITVLPVRETFWI